MSNSKLRKVDSENRAFKSEWEHDYFFILNKDHKPQCLVCFQVLAVLKEYNLKRHYMTNHKQKFGKHSCESRKVVCDQLKKKLFQQKSLFTNETKQQEEALLASYFVTYELMKAKKALSDGELIKNCAIKMAEAFNENKVGNKFQTVPLSKQTVTRRLEDISNQISNNVKDIIANCSYFSIALDESTDVSDTNQLLIFVRAIKEDFTIFEELLKVCSLHSTTRVTDGAKSMTGTISGFVGFLRQNQITVPTLHCIIHQEALCAKSIKLSTTMATVTKITNLIRGGNRSLTHRKFLTLLEEMDSAYGDLLLHTEVRWLSRGKCLVRFFELRHEIATFLREEVTNSAELQNDLEDVEFLRNLAFLTDITQHLNVLNLQLQGKKQTICQMVGFVDSFRKKLHLFKSALDKNNLLHFPCCRKLSEEEEGLEFRDYTEIIEDLSSEFDRRFNDFESFRPDISLFSNPIHCDIESQPGHLQLELCELQCDPSLNTSQVTGIDFWKLLSPERYPLLRNWALKLCSVFASTYICETAFSSLKHVKSKNRNRLSDVVLSHILRVATSQLEVDFISLVSSFMKPQCSH
ncbi:hypothetical protein B7P43_G03218 [Cryptotermes secundus]|uniref:HAT C-terminal dimerisation domain-containing protein n=3 Tax=Cryptotermes secundus TaxID=105785 RepID=A0A2J7PSG6_9NEOP|nr:hypothetical protein B7P43_G08020 [Cryptotermes secundus]PNF27623.1 hypothetical protein B7P43_G15401 [Cryptotermes secundus]PNF29054.1 hypothetical protein B7P43_G13909 [Cryptotermes secundus]PNF31599.1 hypothetical protein B7P43_G18216 [Cryptotermes secundus]PNF33807.1 hypothetical protein B7P43_G10011 [Cryptotermes secundus]